MVPLLLMMAGPIAEGAILREVEQEVEYGKHLITGRLTRKGNRQVSQQTANRKENNVDAGIELGKLSLKGNLQSNKQL